MWVYKWRSPLTGEDGRSLRKRTVISKISAFSSLEYRALSFPTSGRIRLFRWFRLSLMRARLLFSSNGFKVCKKRMKCVIWLRGTSSGKQIQLAQSSAAFVCFPYLPEFVRLFPLGHSGPCKKRLAGLGADTGTHAVVFFMRLSGMFAIRAAELNSAAKPTGFLFIWPGGVRGEGTQATAREWTRGGQCPWEDRASVLTICPPRCVCKLECEVLWSCAFSRSKLKRWRSAKINLHMQDKRGGGG